VEYDLIPFLPLGRADVEECVREDLRLKRKVASRSVVARVVANLRFTPDVDSPQALADSGCKSVSTHVNLYADPVLTEEVTLS